MESLFYTQALQRGISLVLPGLLAAEAVGANAVDTPFLCRFLSRSKPMRAPRRGLESVTCRWFNGSNDSSENCAALLGYRHELPGNELPALLMRSDPVYQQMDVNNALLADQSVLGLELTEAQSLINTLNKHFAEDGVSFEMVDPLRWYCRLDEPFDIRTYSVSQAIGRDVALVRPHGESARSWRRWLAEIEMLLHEHPVNQQRIENGDVPINSLWIWGEGNPQAAKPQKALVLSENFYVKSLASFNDGEAISLDQLAVSESGTPTLVVDDRLARAASTADASLRTTVLQQLEQQVFEPLWANLSRTGWRQASLWVGGEDWFYLDLKSRRRFWQRSRSLSDFVSARSQNTEAPDSGEAQPFSEIIGRDNGS